MSSWRDESVIVLSGDSDILERLRSLQLELAGFQPIWETLSGRRETVILRDLLNRLLGSGINEIEKPTLWDEMRWSADCQKDPLGFEVAFERAWVTIKVLNQPRLSLSAA